MSTLSKISPEAATIRQLIAKRARHVRELDKIERQMQRSLSRLTGEAPSPQFDFYEQVTIVGPRAATHKLRGQRGYVLGRAADEHGRWSYAILVESQEKTWQFAEKELRSTGHFGRREDFYDGSSIRVRVNSDGAGMINAK